MRKKQLFHFSATKKISQDAGSWAGHPGGHEPASWETATPKVYCFSLIQLPCFFFSNSSYEVIQIRDHFIPYR